MQVTNWRNRFNQTGKYASSICQENMQRTSHEFYSW